MDSVESAREYFTAAADAAKDMERAKGRIEWLRNREGLHAASFEPHTTSGISDPTAATDTRMEEELKIQKLNLEYDEAVLDDAWEVVGGISRGLGGSFAQAVSAHYLWLQPWKQVAREFSPRLTVSTVTKMAYAAFDWVDYVGFARAREGIGKVEPF